MTTNLFNPTLGDIGNDATVVAPVQDRSVVMQEQAEVEQAADTARDFNQMAQGIYDIAPVAKEIAAQKFVQKNLVGTDPQQDVAGATQTEITNERAAILGAEAEVEKKLAAEDIKTLRGLELARQQGSISFEEMQIRAKSIRNDAVQRAPLFADHVDQAFRSVVGGTTGIDDSIINPWVRTPEEQAFHEERKINAAYAARFNVDLPTADLMRQEDAFIERRKIVQPRNDNEFQLSANNVILRARTDVMRNIITSANDNGTFDASVSNKLRLDLNNWEAQTIADINQQAANMMGMGNPPTPALVQRAIDDVQEQGTAMRRLLEDNDQAAFVKNMSEMVNAKTNLWVAQFAPQVKIAKEAGVDIIELAQLKFTSPAAYEFITATEGGLNLGVSLLEMSPQDFSLSRFFDAAIPLSGGGVASTPTAPTMDSTMSAISTALNGNDDTMGSLYSLAKESGNMEMIYDSYKLRPESIIALKTRTLDTKPPSKEEAHQSFSASAQGIWGEISANKPAPSLTAENLLTGTAPASVPANFALWVNEDGSVGASGNGVTNVTRGKLQDLYDTIVANEDVWKESTAQNASVYLQSLFPNRIATVTGEASDEVRSLRNLSAIDQVDTIENNLTNYAPNIDDVEAVSTILNQRLMQIPTTFDTLEERNRIIRLQNELWTAHDEVMSETLGE